MIFGLQDLKVPTAYREEFDSSKKFSKHFYKHRFYLFGFQIWEGLKLRRRLFDSKIAKNTLLHSQSDSQLALNQSGQLDSMSYDPYANLAHNLFEQAICVQEC